MKNLFFTLVFSLLTITAFSQADEGQAITVKVENAKNDNGKLLIALHTEADFMKGAGVDSQESKIVDGKGTVTFTNVKPGDYAIMVLHDANDNKRMDFEANGMPKESHGMSNNPRSFGPPIYADAKFDVADEDMEISIRF